MVEWFIIRCFVLMYARAAERKCRAWTTKGSPSISGACQVFATPLQAYRTALGYQAWDRALRRHIERLPPCGIVLYPAGRGFFYAPAPRKLIERIVPSDDIATYCVP